MTLHSNDLELDKILDIEDQLLGSLPSLSFVQIKEAALKCPRNQFCDKKNKPNCQCSNCTNIERFNKLSSIAPKIKVHCFDQKDFEDADKTLKFFKNAMKECETCATIQKQAIQTILIAAAGTNSILRYNNKIVR